MNRNEGQASRLPGDEGTSPFGRFAAGAGERRALHKTICAQRFLALRGANSEQSARMSQLLKSSGAMSVATMLSRVLGLAREMVYSAFMGDKLVAGAFVLAFMVPNLFRRLLGEGALSAAFIPVFKEKEKTAGDAEMWRAANAVLSGLFASTTALVALGVLGISLLLHLGANMGDTLRLVRLLDAGYPWIVLISLAALVLVLRERGRETLSRVGRAGVGIGVGLAGLFLALLGGVALVLSVNLQDGQTLLMLELLRVMFPYVLLVCVAAIFMGMLNARGHFFVPAMGATMLNLVMIASVLLLAPLIGGPLEKRIFGLAIGVVLAGVAQAIFQLPLLHSEGFAYQWVSPWRDETVRHVVKQMVPGAVGVAAFQINVLVTQGFAFLLDGGGTVVASFNYAVRLMELPQGVFGISMATYLLPTLSGLAAEKKYPEFRATLRQGVGWLVFVNLLAGVLLLTLAEPMIRLLFERGLFVEESTARAAGALICLAPGLVAFSLVNILARAFYSLGDTRTPMLISVFCLAVNALLALVLMSRWRQMGLGVANTLSAVINVSLLFYALRRKLKTLEMAEVRRHLPALLGATLVAGGIAWGLAALWESRLGHGTFILKLGELLVPMTVATAAYFGLAVWLKTGYTEELIGLVRARFEKHKIDPTDSNSTTNGHE